MPALILAILYAVLPGHPGLPFRGVPFTPIELGSLLVFSACAASLLRIRPRQESWMPVAVLAVAAAVKLLLAFAWYPDGWLTRYYANDSVTAPTEQSTDFLPWPLSRVWGADVTRIDPVIDFRGPTFPVHFMNESRFVLHDRMSELPSTDGADRSYINPFSVEWRGVLETGYPFTLTLALEAVGDAELLVDGDVVIAVASGATVGGQREELKIARGRHILAVRYRKPANSGAFIRLSRVDGGTTTFLTEPEVVPFVVNGWRPVVAGLLRAPGWMAHGAVLLALFSCFEPLARQRARNLMTAWRANGWREIAPLIVAVASLGLVVQGIVRAQPLVDRFTSVDARAAFFAYEDQARQLVASGYAEAGGVATCFLAAVHAVTGESLAGPVLIGFVLFAVMAVAAFRICDTLAGPRAALVVFGTILLLQQIAVARRGPLGWWPETLYLAAFSIIALVLTRRWHPAVGVRNR